MSKRNGITMKMGEKWRPNDHAQAKRRKLYAERTLSLLAKEILAEEEAERQRFRREFAKAMPDYDDMPLGVGTR